MTQRGIMGVVVLPTIVDEKVPDAQAQIMFTDEVVY